MGERTAVVVGGGISGLATAIALGQRGWRVEILERAEEFGEIGAGLSLWPNAMRALDALGLAGRVRALGGVDGFGGLRSRSGRWLVQAANDTLERDHGWPLIMVHRADLLRVLTEAVPAGSLRASTAVTSVEADGDALVVHHGDTTTRADLVVGADGLRSGVRRQWWPHARAPRYSGYTAWRMVTEPLTRPPGEGSVVWGRGERFGVTAMTGGRLYCFATANAPEGGTGGHAELAARFGDWPDPIPELLAATHEDAVLRHDIYDLPPLRSFSAGRVVLVGDAAHAMTPGLGQGACQALEDAVTLAACVTGPIDEGLARYDRLRVRRTRSVVRRSARLGAVGQWSWPPAVALRDFAARLSPVAATTRSLAPILGWVPPECSGA